MLTLPPPIENGLTGQPLSDQVMVAGREAEIAQRLKKALRLGLCSGEQLSRAIKTGSVAALVRDTTVRWMESISAPCSVEPEATVRAKNQSADLCGECGEALLLWVKYMARAGLLSAGDVRAVARSEYPRESLQEVVEKVLAAGEQPELETALRDDVPLLFTPNLYLKEIQCVPCEHEVVDDQCAGLSVDMDDPTFGIDLSWVQNIPEADRRIVLELIERLCKALVLPDGLSVRSLLTDGPVMMEMFIDDIEMMASEVGGLDALIEQCEEDAQAGHAHFDPESLRAYKDWQGRTDEKPDWMKPLSGKTARLVKRITTPDLVAWCRDAQRLIELSERLGGVSETINFLAHDTTSIDTWNGSINNDEADEWTMWFHAVIGDALVDMAHYDAVDRMMQVGAAPERIFPKPGRERDFVTIANARLFAVRLLATEPGIAAVTDSPNGNTA
jgi:hypothetical protein